MPDGEEADLSAAGEGVPASPRGVQVELNVGAHESIPTFMNECGYELAARHFTHKGKEAQSRGLPVEAIAHNAIFAPVGSFSGVSS